MHALSQMLCDVPVVSQTHAAIRLFGLVHGTPCLATAHAVTAQKWEGPY